MASNSHVTLKNVTVDNLETISLSADGLWTVVQSLANQRAQDGEAGSYVFEGLVVPFILYKTAKETMNSQLAPFSGENQINIFDTDFGTVRIAASIFTWINIQHCYKRKHVLPRSSGQHMSNRKVHRELYTSMILPEYTGNDSIRVSRSFPRGTFPRVFLRICRLKRNNKLIIII